MFLAKIYVTLKPKVNDPQGYTIMSSLKVLGFKSISGVRTGKYLEVRVNGTNRNLAESQVEEMCDKLLANPVIEDYLFELTEI